MSFGSAMFWHKVIIKGELETMGDITYKLGDATNPQTQGNKLIVHCCNNIGAWGKGFVLAISKQWPQAEKAYREWFKNKANNDFALGEVQFVQVASDIWIANLIGQNGIRSKTNPIPINYFAIENGLVKVSVFATNNNCSIHMPRIGCGLAGGKWDKMVSIIGKTLVKSGLDVTIYDL